MNYLQLEVTLRRIDFRRDTPIFIAFDFRRGDYHSQDFVITQTIFTCCVQNAIVSIFRCASFGFCQLGLSGMSQILG